MNYNLNIGKDYVSTWGLNHSLREVFQNMVDSDIKGYKANYEYLEKEKELIVSNEGAKLHYSTLVLGGTSKVDDVNQLGMHGEGYKLAVNVLLREGKEVVIEDGCGNEWFFEHKKTNLIKEPVLTLRTKKQTGNKKQEGVKIIIKGITKEEFEEYRSHNLLLQGEYSKIDSVLGSILMDDKHRGKIFVGGLYVQDTNFQYGYDIAVGHIKLERDRSLLDSYDLKELISHIVIKTGDEKLFDKMIEMDAPELENYDGSGAYVLGPKGEGFYAVHPKEYTNIVMSNFKTKYGSKAIPVVTDEEYKTVENQGYTPVVVTKTKDRILSGPTNKKQIVTEKTVEGSNVLRDFVTFVERTIKLEDSEIEEYNKLLLDLKVAFSKQLKE